MGKIDKKTKAELIEWFGVAKADWILYIAFILIVVGCFLNNLSLILILFLGGVVLGIYSIVIGTKKNKDLSDLTNLIKKISYPLGMLILIIMIVAKFLFFFNIIKF